MESLTYLFRLLHWFDIVDIIVVTTSAVWLYLWVKGTRAFKVMLGLSLLVLVYLMAQAFGMVLTSWALQWLGQAILILVVILFAPEIRQVLERINPLRIWSRSGEEELDFVDSLVEALEELCRTSTGALFVIEREDRLEEWVRPGIASDAVIQKELLLAIFHPATPTHDGAVWIRNGRIHQVGVFLPISQVDLPVIYGGRHRAAVGISEVSDAIVLVVSEERGEVSLAERGRISRVRDLEALGRKLRSELQLQPPVTTPSWRSVFLKEWRIKLLILLIVSVIWFSLTDRQPGQGSYRIPLRFEGLPQGLVLDSNPPSRVRIRLLGPRRSLAAVKSAELQLVIDLSHAREGSQFMTLDPSQLPLPPDIRVGEIDPAVVQIDLKGAGEPLADP